MGYSNTKIEILRMDSLNQDPVLCSKQTLKEKNCGLKKLHSSRMEEYQYMQGKINKRKAKVEIVTLNHHKIP